MRGARALLLASLAAGALACGRSNDDAARGATARRDGGAADAQGPTVESVAFRTADGWTIHGSWLTGTGAATVVLAHQLGANRAEWEPLVTALRASTPAPSVLTIDLRGHGESTLAPGGIQTRWPSFENAPERWRGMSADVAAAVAYARSRRGAAGVVVVGSSIGATAALGHASVDRELRAVVLLSPGLAYRGVDAMGPAGAYLQTGRPAMLVAGQGDAASVDAVNRMVERANAPGSPPSRVERLVFSDTGAHGTALGAPGIHPELWASIARWVRELPPPSQ